MQVTFNLTADLNILLSKFINSVEDEVLIEMLGYLFIYLFYLFFFFIYKVFIPGGLQFRRLSRTFKQLLTTYHQQAPLALYLYFTTWRECPYHRKIRSSSKRVKWSSCKTK